MRFCPDIQAGFLDSQSLALIFFDGEIRALKKITFELTVAIFQATVHR